VIERDTIISCRNSQGAEIQATPVRLNRFAAVFEVYNPYSILQLSEVLLDFRISIGERLV
jgi:extracellular factor (EF) 3-hydroxypalmitic acid methyl ester biosynthesis protein